MEYIRRHRESCTPHRGAIHPSGAQPIAHEEVAAPVALLCPDAAAFISGADLAINGGMHMEWRPGTGIA
jgi:hypothetical protein